jgi:hypothetical protein
VGETAEVGRTVAEAVRERWGVTLEGERLIARPGPRTSRCRLAGNARRGRRPGIRSGSRTLLKQRATGTAFTSHAGSLHVDAPHGAVICLWNGATTARYTADGTPTRLDHPHSDPEDPSTGRRGAAVFTRGDRFSAGWLAVCNGVGMSPPSTSTPSSGSKNSPKPAAGAP